MPGEDWANRIDEELRRADIILLLVSIDFINSDYCYELEMMEALARQERGEAVVIPVILRPFANEGAAEYYWFMFLSRYKENNPRGLHESKTAAVDFYLKH